MPHPLWYQFQLVRCGKTFSSSIPAMEKCVTGEVGDHDAVAGASACNGEDGTGEDGAREDGDGEVAGTPGVAGARGCPGSGGAVDWYLCPEGVLISS